MRQRVDVETVDALIYKIAINLASSRRRSARLWRWISLDVVRHEATTDRSMDEAMSAHEDHVRVRAAVEALPEDLRRVIMLCNYSDLNYKQVAHVLSIPPGTVGSKRHRAVRLLREHLRREGDT
jgi:RNA polymerase sigma-70 factor (ECF subfamily)